MNCLICNTLTQTFVDEKTGIIYFHCPHCECISKSPENFTQIFEQKERYDLHDNDPEHEGYRAYFGRFLDFVLPLVEDPKTALDFGCGRSTLLADLMRERGIVCDYYDPIYYPVKPNHSKKYGLIVSTEVFEHLHDPKTVFSGLYSMLEKGGYLAIQTQFHPNNTEAFKKWYYHQDPTHIVFFTSKTFQVLCDLYGFGHIKDNEKNMVVIRKVD